MTLTIDLPPSVEEQLQRMAYRAGKPAPQYALELLREQLDRVPKSPNDLPSEERQQRFEAFLAEFSRPVGHFVDDSRESIYEGRGE